MTLSSKRTVERWAKNGVRVKVERWEGKSVREATCHCLGFDGRTHDNADCPNLRRQMREARC